ncbi:MAG: hypothetical protein K5639_00525 [Eubacterium sp.]|nr:hypothetical protein [Eubacterium sp.]
MVKLKEKQPIDVICQHSKDGEIIPIKIRLTDEDGVCQEYKIRDFRIVPVNEKQYTPDGLFVSAHTTVYECKIITFKREKTIHINYRCSDGIWSVFM